jgi:hypothetical protein
MAEQKCKINVTGRNPQDKGVRITPTTMHLDIAQEIEDYSLKVGMMVIGV